MEVTAITTAGTQWTSRSGANFGNRDIAFGNGIYVAIPDTNVVFTSTDGSTWTQRSIPTASIWRGITYANGIFVAVGSVSGTGTVMTSPDGIAWTSRTPSANYNWESIAYGNNIFVAVASSGTVNRVMTSPDGITWTSRASASDDSWYSVTYGNGQFVAVSAIGFTYSVMTSPDGITWTGHTATIAGWNSITYGGGLFVAVGEWSPHVMTSPDGITWTDRTAAATNSWRAVTYGNGLFVAVAGSGTGNRVMTSPDGITWTSRTTPEDNSWTGITFGNNLFVAVANSGTNRVMTSSGAFSTAIIANGGINVDGNVGIGTTSPSQKLDVRGDIKLGTSGELYAVGGVERLKIIRGTINANGTIRMGTGFSVNRLGAGYYRVNFFTAFSAAPTIIVSAVGAAGPGDGAPWFQTANLRREDEYMRTTSQFEVVLHYQQLGGTSDTSDRPWDFIAIGY